MVIDLTFPGAPRGGHRNLCLKVRKPRLRGQPVSTASLTQSRSWDQARDPRAPILRRPWKDFTATSCTPPALCLPPSRASCQPGPGEAPRPLHLPSKSCHGKDQVPGGVVCTQTPTSRRLCVSDFLPAPAHRLGMKGRKTH